MNNHFCQSHLRITSPHGTTVKCYFAGRASVCNSTNESLIGWPFRARISSWRFSSTAVITTFVTLQFASDLSISSARWGSLTTLRVLRVSIFYERISEVFSPYPSQFTNSVSFYKIIPTLLLSPLQLLFSGFSLVLLNWFSFLGWDSASHSLRNPWEQFPQWHILRNMILPYKCCTPILLPYTAQTGAAYIRIDFIAPMICSRWIYFGPQLVIIILAKDKLAVTAFYGA